MVPTQMPTVIAVELSQPIAGENELKKNILAYKNIFPSFKR